MDEWVLASITVEFQEDRRADSVESLRFDDSETHRTRRPERAFDGKSLLLMPKRTLSLLMDMDGTSETESDAQQLNCIGALKET
jgi:hypothetical protein